MVLVRVLLCSVLLYLAHGPRTSAHVFGVFPQLKEPLRGQ